jgi:hypothetical protein
MILGNLGTNKGAANMTEVQVLYGLIILVPVLIFASMLCYGIYRFAKQRPVLFSLAMHVPVGICFAWIMNYAYVNFGADWEPAIVASCIIMAAGLISSGCIHGEYIRKIK